MEMTRRKFIAALLSGAAIVLVKTWSVTKSAGRKIVFAVKGDKYPGGLKHLQNIDKNAKWRG